MKSTSFFGVLCLLTLSACGQPHPNDRILSGTDSAKIYYYENRSAFYQKGKPDSAIYFADKGLKLSRSLQSAFGEAMMMNRFARINEQYGNLQLAVKYEKEALAIFNSLHDTAASSDAAINLGLLEGKGGNFKAGLHLIVEGLNQYEQSKNTKGMIRAYTKMGEVNEMSGDKDKALQFYTRAEQLNNGLPLSDEYFSLINSIGTLHTKLGNHQKAVNYYETGMSKSEVRMHGREYISFLNNAAKVWDTLGDKTKALAYHQQGLQKAKEFGLPEEEVRSLVDIATTLKSRDADLSIGHLKNALVIANSIGHKQLSAEIYHSLSDIYRQQSRYQEALAALEEHHRLLDSLVNANKGHKIAVLQSSYELAESKLHIETLELSNQQKTYQRNAGILAIAAILIILLVLTGYFYKTSRLNKRLEASNLIKDKLFSIIGHDLRNPIGGITQLLSLMEEGHLTSEEHQQMIATMRKQGDITLEILNALLNWGEAQLKGIHIKPAMFNPQNYILKNTEALHKQANDKSITITDYTSQELMAFGDVNHFDFIIRNLLSNAIKFSHPSGTIEVNADIKPGSDKVIFSVKDHGKGISKTQQELFLKSNLNISYGTSGEKGTGIGLMLCKEFIKANGGRIWIESEEGKGATFYFTFPTQTPQNI